MKFINYIEKISGVDIMGISSLLLFVVFFSIMLTWVIRSEKKKMDEISRLPLDN
jgi:preprotein translocase subunit YajC